MELELGLSLAEKKSPYKVRFIYTIVQLPVPGTVCGGPNYNNTPYCLDHPVTAPHGGYKWGVSSTTTNLTQIST